VTQRSNTTLFTLLALGALAAAGCSRAGSENGAEATPPPALPEDVQSVAAAVSPGAEGAAEPQGDAARDALAAGGRLAVNGEFVPPIRSDLVPRTGGRVARVLVDEGQRVTRGQPLLELETDYLKLDVARAAAEKARALAAADEARRDLERKTDLVGRGSVSQATFLRSKAGAEQAEAAVAGAEAALALAQQRLDDSVLTSPVTGVVAARRTDVGERLGEGSVAFVVEQTAPLKLRFRVPERYLARVQAGQAVAAHVDPYPDEAFDGTVSLVGGSVDPSSRTFLVEAEFPNRDGRLRPGLFAQVELKLGEE
jgi:membrane fusion protein (multidrug efflux system)